MCSEIILLKLLPYLPGANELTVELSRYLARSCRPFWRTNGIQNHEFNLYFLSFLGTDCPVPRTQPAQPMSLICTKLLYNRPKCRYSWMYDWLWYDRNLKGDVDPCVVVFMVPIHFLILHITISLAVDQTTNGYISMQLLFVLTTVGTNPIFSGYCVFTAHFTVQTDSTNTQHIKHTDQIELLFTWHRRSDKIQCALDISRSFFLRRTCANDTP